MKLPKSVYAKRKQRQREAAFAKAMSFFQEAESSFAKGKTDRAHDIVKKVRRIMMKFKLRLPPSIKQRICKHCHHYLQQGVNCRVRLHQGRVIYYCLDCKHFRRFPYKIGSSHTKGKKQVIPP